MVESKKYEMESNGLDSNSGLEISKMIENGFTTKLDSFPQI